MNFDFHPDAREEFREAAHWYEDRSIFAGDRFVKAVRAAIGQIMLDPARHQSLDQGIRVFRLKVFPYRVYYVHEEQADLIRVYAVMHEKRQPDYWRDRLGK